MFLLRRAAEHVATSCKHTLKGEVASALHKNTTLPQKKQQWINRGCKENLPQDWKRLSTWSYSLDIEMSGGCMRIY